MQLKKLNLTKVSCASVSKHQRVSQYSLPQTVLRGQFPTKPHDNWNCNSGYCAFYTQFQLILVEEFTEVRFIFPSQYKPQYSPLMCTITVCQANWWSSVVVTASFIVTACDFIPNTRGQAAEQEGDVTLDEGWEEGKHTVDGEGNEEGLPSANAICQPAPYKGPDHHSQVHDQTWGSKVRFRKQGKIENNVSGEW